MAFFRYLNTTTKKILICLVLGFLAFISAIAIAKWHSQQDSIAIAIVAPLSHANEVVVKRGQSIVDGVKLYINNFLTNNF